MKKKIFLFICLFFTLQMSVFAKICPKPVPGKDPDNKTIPVLYENKVGTLSSLGSECGGSVTSRATPKNELVKLDPDDGVQPSGDDYKCYQKRKVLIMLDDSNSMGEGKLLKAEDLIEKISESLDKTADRMAVCYFSGECKKNGKFISPKRFEDVDLNKKNENTNFTLAYENIRNMLSKNDDSNGDYIPIVFFITDGYPTEYTTEDSKTIKLGYLSSAKYGFKAANRLENLIHDMQNGIFTSDTKNPYRKSNARIVTVGVGINGNDNFVKFILDPTETNKNALSGDESSVLKELIENPTKKQRQLVAGACSFPDKSGLVSGKYTHANGKYRADFSGNKLDNIKDIDKDKDKDKDKDTEKDICFTAGSENDDIELIRTNKDGDWINIKSSCITKITEASNNGSGPNDGTIIRLKNSCFVKNRTYRLRSSKDFKKYPPKGTIQFAGVFGQYFGNNAIQNLKKVLGTSGKNDPLKFDPTPDQGYLKDETKKIVTHTNAKSITIINNFPNAITYNGKKYSKFEVDVLLTENTGFNAGTLGSIEKVPSGGRGFNFKDVNITNKIKWYYRKFATNNNGTPANPIIRLCKISKDCVEVKQNADVTINNLDSLIWKKLNAAPYINDISSTIKTAFKTIDSNNKKNNNSTLPIDVTMIKNCDNVVNADSDINSLCTITYNVSQKVGCVNKKTKIFAYGDVCDDGTNYSQNDSNSLQYYVPYDLEKRDDVSININSAFSSIGLNITGNNKCSFDVGGSNDGNPPTQFSNLIYRSIDVGEPFPAYNVNKQLDTIPINWRSWYDNVTNRSRLKNSYEAGKLNYTIVLDNAKISEINKNTNLNPNVYSRLEEMNNNGTNNFVSKYVMKNNTTNKNYCLVSEFDEQCDK